MKRRITKIIGISVIVDVSFYLVIAAAGFFSTFDDTAKIVLNRPSIHQGVDYAILIA